MEKSNCADWGELPKERIRRDRAALHLIGVPMDLGADRRGVDMGPSAVRGAHFVEHAHELGYDRVVDKGDVFVPAPESRTQGESNAKYLTEIATACDELRQRALGALEAGETPVIVGGDHAIAAGTVAGVSEFFHKKQQKLGLIWIDAHADMNTPDTSPTGNIHGMPLAVALGLGPDELVQLGGFCPKVQRENVVLLGIRNLDEVEKEIVRRSGVHAYTMRDIDERGMHAIMQEALGFLNDGTVGYHVSFDLDSMDPRYAPGVGTPVPGGLTYREAHLLMEMAADDGHAVSFEMTEINPILDHKNQTGELAVDLLLSGLGKRIL
ncbi:MAG: arginase [Planctomycetota bacterium]|nr:MAG: arginase [Planctomycetota bacterium]